MAPAKGKKEEAEAETRAGPPAWLDAVFIEEALRIGGRPAKVAGLTARHANAVGDHYASSMFRVVARLGSGEQVPLIVKCAPEGDKMAEAVANSGVFTIEGAVLGRLGPRIHAILEEAFPGEFPPFCARCLHHCEAPNPFLVLEDLSPAGFRLADRFRGLGLRHSLLVVRSLARYHAASAALLKREPAAFDGLPDPYKGNAREAFDKMMRQGFQQFSAELRRWEDVPADYADRIDTLVDTAYEKLIEANNPLPGQLNVLVHGDCWTNNFLFRYAEDGRVEDMRFVDFQVSHYGSPAVDLLYFLCTSVSEDVHIHHSDLLRREYLHELNRTLRALSLADRQMSWELLKAAEQACGTHAVFGAFFVLPIVKSPPGRAFDAEEAMGDGGEGNAHLYANPPFRPWAKRLLAEFDRKGWI